MERTLASIKDQATYGAASRLDVAQFEQNVGSERAAQAALIEQRVETRNALTMLLDGRPFPESSELQTVPEGPPPPVDAGLPASLLARRPDLRAAEMRLREAIASADATRMSFYPQITLTGGAGTASLDLSQALQNPIGTVTATLTMPFVQINQAKHATALACVRQEEVFVSFRKALLQAMYEVDNELSMRRQLTEESVHLQHALNAAKEVERLFEVRYINGSVPLQPWLDAQQTRRLAETNLAGNRFARLRNFVDLCQALGGSAQAP